MKEVYIAVAVRTPIGSFGGSLSGFSAVQLGSFAIEGAIKKINLPFNEVDEVFMGNVLSAGLGQAPARQAAIGAGIGHQVPCTTINKVCSSGMKSVMLGVQSIMLGINQVVVAGGMESMSNVPYYLSKARFGYKYDHHPLLDGLVHDGLWEAYHKVPMGNCADHIAEKMNILRKEQDDYAIESYRRASSAVKHGYFEGEIIPITIPQRKGTPLVMQNDESPEQVKINKIPSLNPVFTKDGTVTAANASTINDGAAALILMSKEKAELLNIRCVAKIRGFADASQAPILFTTSPSLALPKACVHANVLEQEVDYWEINEAFSVVALANMQKLNLSYDRVNVFGGAVSLGHPLGASGARIMATLISVLKHKQGKIGAAGICNGGGGASAMVIEMC